MIYSIYHIPGIKIGCSYRVDDRVKEQGYTDYDVLETHTDIDIASIREHVLQKEYGFRVDICKYSTTINSSKKGGDKTSLLGVGIHTAENRSKNGKLGGKKAGKIGGKTTQSIMYICPHCNTEMKGSNYFRWHGDNCKYA